MTAIGLLAVSYGVVSAQTDEQVRTLYNSEPSGLILFFALGSAACLTFGGVSTGNATGVSVATLAATRLIWLPRLQDDIDRALD